MWMRWAPISRSAGSFSDERAAARSGGRAASVAGGDEVFEVGVVAAEGVAGALAQRRPAGAAPSAGGAVGAPVRATLLALGVEARRRVGDRLASRPVVVARRRRRPRPASTRRLARLCGAPRRASSRSSSGLRSSSVSTNCAQLDIGQLQQANGLLQLGCHHQLLALPQLQLWRKRHVRAPIVATDVLTGSRYKSARINRTCPPGTPAARLRWL